MTVERDVDANPYEGLEVDEMAKERAKAGAIKGKQAWQENLQQGEGATGSHPRRYRNTGEAIGDITIEEVDEFQLLVGGDVPQIWVAEKGRPPGSPPPPFDAIMEWAHERGIVSQKTLWPSEADSFQEFLALIGDDQVREDVLFVWRTMWHIAEHGIEGFAPALKASRDTAGEYGREAEEQLDEAIEDASE